MYRKITPLCLLVFLLSLAWPQVTAAATWRVGLQVGHWRSNELPDELQTLRTSTGTAAAGIREVQVNLDIAQRTAAYLQAADVAVDLLPATVPPSYRADAFVTIHADGSSNSRLRGFKAATQWREWEAGLALVDALRQEYGKASGLAWDGGRITSGMRGYYAFSSGRFRHAISNDTPGAILEMGYLTNPADRQLMLNQSDRLARGVADGILRFLRSKPTSGWPAPPALPAFRATVITQTANLRSGPDTSYPIVRRVQRGRMLLVEEVRGEWVKLISYRGAIRWTHRDNLQLERINDDPPSDA
jgi:N-acetylmuramoyl-L-alanine amidase